MTTAIRKKQTLEEMHQELIRNNENTTEEDQYSLAQPTPMKIVDSRASDHTSLYDEPLTEVSA